MSQELLLTIQNYCGQIKKVLSTVKMKKFEMVQLGTAEIDKIQYIHCLTQVPPSLHIPEHAELCFSIIDIDVNSDEQCWAISQ